MRSSYQLCRAAQCKASLPVRPKLQGEMHSYARGAAEVSCHCLLEGAALLDRAQSRGSNADAGGSGQDLRACADAGVGGVQRAD